jgi:DNA-binding transcriptional LysR family regulator
MTLKQLEAFYWSAILGSFALAAERLFMTQSALSKRIQELELEIGVPLFDRSGPRARITDAGENILSRAEQLLSLRDEIVVAARGPSGLRGTCRFGVSELMAMRYLPSIVAAIRRDYPDVILEPRVAVTKELLEDVEKGVTEFAMAPGRSLDPAVISEQICEVPLLWVASPGLFHEDRPVTAEELQHHPIISMSDKAGSTMQLLDLSARRGLRFRRVLTTNSPEAVAVATIAGLGVALLGGPFVERYLTEGKLVRLAVEDRLHVPDLAYCIHWRAENSRVLARKLREISRDICLAGR